jgi:hypothetical protein
MWLLAIGVSIIGCYGLSFFGYFDPKQSLYHAVAWNPWASITGGLVFGYGMALAGNCGFGALARLGGGDLRSFVIVLVMGISAYVVLSGPLAELRLVLFADGSANTSEVTGYPDLVTAVTGLPGSIAGIVIGIAITAAVLWSPILRAAPQSIFWSLIVACAIVSGWAGTQWVAINGFDELPVVSHTFSAPIGETLLYVMTSTGSSFDFGIGSVAGVMFGAFIGSLIKGHFRWEACEDPRELRRQIMGGALMGCGAVVALGCTIGQGISAFSVLSFSAPVTFLAMFLGAAFGLRQLITGLAPAE